MLILKYQNIVKELEYQQNLEMSKFNKNVKLSQIDNKKKNMGGLNTSTFGSTSRYRASD